MLKLKHLIIICIIGLLGSAGVTWYFMEIPEPPKPKPKWDAIVWANTVSRNHTKISECYGYVIDNHIENFKQACDITTLVIIENTIVREYNNQYNNHPGISKLEFLKLFYDQNIASRLLSHLEHQRDFNMTLMILMITDAIINSNNIRTNHAPDIYTIPTRANS